MILGEKIQQLRKLRGMSQEQLAEKLDVSRQSISKWELNDSIPDLNKVVILSELFSISIDELIKENSSYRQSLKPESINCNENRKKNLFKSEDDVNQVIQDKLLDNYIGKVCSVELTRWNDGVNNAYLTSYDNYFLYYMIIEKNECKIGALGKKYIRQVETKKVENIEISRKYQIEEINKEFFIGKKVNVYLEDKHFWSGLIGEEIEYLNLTVREFDDKKIYVFHNVNELTLLICKIAKLEIY